MGAGVWSHYERSRGAGENTSQLQPAETAGGKLPPALRASEEVSQGIVSTPRLELQLQTLGS